MNEYENNEYNSQQGQDPIPPTSHDDPAQQSGSAPYSGAGTGRRESPYAGSPYEMNHHQVPPQYNYRPQPDPSYQPPKDPAPKPGHHSGKRILAALLAVVLVAGSCGATAMLVNRRWNDRTQQMQTEFNQKLTDMQKQIDSAKKSTIISGNPVNSGDSLSPSQVYANNVDSVVAISSTIQTTSFYGTSQGTATGSGFILTQDGYIITNCHVVEGASEVSVITHDGTEYPATIVGTYATNDIAVLKVDATDLPAATIGSSDSLNIGDMVVAIGNPLGTLTATQTVGYVSGKDRDISTDGSVISMIQTDAAINSGNSGGPLFNMYGEVVGVTSAKYSGNTGSGAAIEGIGFAIPIDDVTSIISDLIDYGYVTGAYLGVRVSDTDAESAAKFGLPVGAYVHSVDKGGCAEKAGVQAKDIIVDLGGYEVKGYTTLARALRNFKAGDTTTITVIRSGNRMTLDITLDEKPQAQQATAPTEDTENMPNEGDPNEWFEYYRRYFGK